MERRPATAHGMTLIELLIAIALLAIVTTLSYRGLDALSRGSERLLGENERWQAVAAFFGRFATDVAQAVPRPIRIGPMPLAAAEGTQPRAMNPQGSAWLGGAVPVLTTPVADGSMLAAWYGQPLPAFAADDGGHAAQLEFTRKSPDGRDEVRIGYRLRGTRLELLLWPVLDRAPNSKPGIYTVLDGVTDLRLRHLDDAGAWQESWPPGGGASEKLPRAIEIELDLQDGTRLRRVFALPS